MSPAALKRALDPAYIGAPFAQPFQFFDGDVSTPMDLTGRTVVLFLDKQGLPDAHHEITGAIQTDGRVLFSAADTSAWIKGDYSLEVRLDGVSVAVGRIVVAKGAGASGSDMVGAAQPPTAPGVVIAGSGVVQVVSVAPSAAPDPSAIILAPDLSAALGGAETLADALLWLAQNGGTPSPILRDLIGGVVISSVATGALSVEAADAILLSGAISVTSSATGALSVEEAAAVLLAAAVTVTSGLTGDLSVEAGAEEEPAVRNAVVHYLPGYNNVPSGTSTGAPVPWTVDYVNFSRAPITTISLAFIGWYLAQATTPALGNDVPTTANVTYGGTTTVLTSGGSTTITIPNDGKIATDAITLPTPIPPGATFTVSGVTTVAAGLKYSRSGASGAIGVGFAGVRTHVADGSTLCPVSGYYFGDSIATNNSAVLLQAALAAGVPFVGHSISGSRLNSFADNGGANFAKLLDLFEFLGCTDMACNSATNDLAAGATVATMTGQIATLRDQIRSVGGRWHHATLLPRTESVPVTALSLTSSGTLATVTVPDAAKFVVGQAYSVSGATPAEYNTTFAIIETRNTVANTITYRFPGSATPTAAGTITLRGASTNFSSREMQAPAQGYEAGSGSVRAQFNAWIRTPGNVDSVIEWGDAVEVTRNDGLWARGGEKPQLPAEFTATVVADPAPTNRVFFVNSTSVPSMAGAVGGRFISGSLQGVGFGPGSTSTPGRVALLGSDPNLPAAPVAGDVVTLVSQHIAGTTDGLHPKSASPSNAYGPGVYFGGQQLIVEPTVAWLTALAA